MPSGAKKRKAAKKKKEKDNTINPQGNGELKSRDVKGSDGSEGSSPAYHGHDNHHDPFNGGSQVVEEGDPSAVEPPAFDAKSMEEVPRDAKVDDKAGGNEAIVVTIERDPRPEVSSEAENVSFEHIEMSKESYNMNGNAGDNSNDESSAEKNSKDENYSSIEEAVTCHELVDSSTSKMTLIPDNALTEATGNSAVECSVNPVKAVASVSDVERSDTVSVLLEKSVVPFQGVTDLAVKINGDNILPLTDEKAIISSLEEPKPKECNSEVLASSSASPSTKFNNGAERNKDFETPASSENQPLVASAPPIVQKTSWLSCCGLFEVLLGSNR